MFADSNDPIVIRKIQMNPKDPQKIFLTFDDGPSDRCTHDVLNILKKHRANATFFVIGAKALQNPLLIQKMRRAGHAVYSHSSDHNYFHYFKNETHLENWIQFSMHQLQELTQMSTACFRPPAGVLTPPLVRAARNIKVPLILWTHRFYDTVRKLTVQKIDLALKQVQSGDIILLHDEQKPKNQESFLKSLDYFLAQLKKQGFEISALEKSDLSHRN